MLAPTDIVVASDEALFGHAAFRYAGWAARQMDTNRALGSHDKGLRQALPRRIAADRRRWNRGVVGRIVDGELRDRARARRGGNPRRQRVRAPRLQAINVLVDGARTAGLGEAVRAAARVRRADARLDGIR